MDEKQNEIFRWAKKILWAVFGISTTGYGIACYLSSGLGSDPVSAFTQGVHVQLHINYKISVFIVNGIPLLILLIMNKKSVKTGTFLFTLTLGAFVDFYTKYFPLANQNSSLALRTLAMIVGATLLGIGLGVFFSANVGVGPIESILKLIAYKLNVRFWMVKIVCDVLMTAFAFFMGGVIGAGTIAGVIVTGPIIDFISSKINALSSAMTS